jgi:hypothetical protein
LSASHAPLTAAPWGRAGSAAACFSWRCPTAPTPVPVPTPAAPVPAPAAPVAPRPGPELPGGCRRAHSPGRAPRGGPRATPAPAPSSPSKAGRSANDTEEGVERRRAAAPAREAAVPTPAPAPAGPRLASPGLELLCRCSAGAAAPVRLSCWRRERARRSISACSTSPCAHRGAHGGRSFSSHPPPLRLAASLACIAAMGGGNVYAVPMP